MTIFIQPSPSATTDALHKMLLDYNWDDGFAFPSAIANHPSCDLGVALELFWLADAISVYLGETLERESNVEWHSFCKELIQRLLDGHYIQGTTSFEVPLTKTQVYKYQKRGVPGLFLTDV